MDFVQIKIPFRTLVSNTQLFQLALISMAGGADVLETVNGFTTYSKIKNDNTTYELFNYNGVAMIVAIGGEVYNYHSYIKVNLEDIVPSYIRDAIGNIKWKDWIHTNQIPIVIDNDTYISSCSHYAGGTLSDKINQSLTGTELTQLISNGYTVLNKEQFIQLKDAESNE